MKNITRITLLVFLHLFMSCKQESGIKTFEFTGYSIELPRSWEKIKSSGIDSNSEIIVTSNKDSILFDLGDNSERFNETVKVFSKAQIRKYDSLQMETNNLFSSDTPEIDQAQGTFLNEYYYYDSIDNHQAKIKLPKRDIGIIGIEFPDVNGKRLAIVARNLSRDERESLLRAFQTVKFVRN